MFERDLWHELISGGRGRPPRTLTIVMLLLVGGAVADSIGSALPVLEVLRLSTRAWTGPEPWRVVTYGLVGAGGLSMLTVLQLVAVYWFSMELITWIGLRRARVLVLGGIVGSGVSASLVQWLSDLAGGPGCDYAPFWLMQGQAVVLAIVMSAFAAHARWTTVSDTTLLWGLPVPARWFVPLQLGGAVLGFVATGDLGGMVGIAVAVGWGYRLGATRPRRRRLH